MAEAVREQKEPVAAKKDKKEKKEDDLVACSLNLEFRG